MGFLDNIKIGRKLIGSFLIVIIILAIVSVIGFVNMKSINDGMTTMYQDRLVPMSHLSNADSAYRAIRGDTMKYVLIPEIRKDVLKTIDENEAALKKEMDAYRATQLLDEEKQQLAKFDSAWSAYLREEENIQKLADANNEKEAINSIKDGGSFANARKPLEESIAALIDINVKTADRLNTQGDATFAASSLMIVVASLLGIIIALVLAVLITRSITVPLNKTVEMLREMGLGHLSNRLKLNRKDEIGDMAGTMDQFCDDLQNHVIKVLQKIAAGERVELAEVKDDKDEIDPALRDLVVTLRGLTDETGNLINAALKGDLSVRGDTTKFKGRFMEIIDGFNKTLETIILPLNEAMRLADHYAKRDFSVRFDSTMKVEGEFAKFKDSFDKLGDAISGALGLIQNQVQELAASAEEANASSEEVAAGSQQVAKNSAAVSNNAETSDKGLNQVLKAMEDLSSTVNEVAVKIEAVSKLSGDANGLSKQGVALAGKAEDGMTGITKSTGEINGIINDIRSQMDEIGKIVGLIGDIADQTNLLALNAAIEAARAGDAGLGFAVVANEVKSLAQESQASAENIADIIGTLQKKSDLAAEAMKNANNDVKEGGKAVTETLHIFNEIVTAVESINENVSEVASAAEEQAASTEEITASINEVSALVKNTAKEAMDSAAASEEASAAIDQIVKVVGNVNEIVNNITKEMGKFTL